MHFLELRFLLFAYCNILSDATHTSDSSFTVLDNRSAQKNRQIGTVALHLQTFTSPSAFDRFPVDFFEQAGAISRREDHVIGLAEQTRGEESRAGRALGRDTAYRQDEQAVQSKSSQRVKDSAVRSY